MLNFQTRPQLLFIPLPIDAQWAWSMNLMTGTNRHLTHQTHTSEAVFAMPIGARRAQRRPASIRHALSPLPHGQLSNYISRPTATQLSSDHFDQPSLSRAHLLSFKQAPPCSPPVSGVTHAHCHTQLTRCRQSGVHASCDW